MEPNLRRGDELNEARETLAAFRNPASIEIGSTVHKRNAVRTYHDYLKLLLSALGPADLRETIKDLNLVKRFSLLKPRFPEIERFRKTFMDCWAARSVVDHSDTKAPDIAVLKNWDAVADELLGLVISLQHTGAKSPMGCACR